MPGAQALITPPRKAGGRKPRRVTRRLAIAIGDAESPPKEFRLFTAGWNDTENGRFLFDDVAAAATMAAYKKWGVDLAIDLEHQMLDPDIAPDPTAKDARGWCKLELRDDGSLWAVNVTWTADGEARLTEKRQRYISPAFGVDPETSRVTSILNVAITAIPATHDTPALIAARVAVPRDWRRLSTGAAFSAIQSAIGAALAMAYPQDESDGFCGGPWVQDVFDASVVFDLKGVLYEASYTFDGSKATLGAPVEVKRSYAPVQAPAPVAAKKKITAKLSAAGEPKMDAKQITAAIDALTAGDADKCMELLKGIIATAAGGEPTESDPAGADPVETAVDPNAPPPAEKKEEVAAASARLMRLSGKTTFVDAVAETEVWRASHIKHETEMQKLAAERATLEAAERRKGCVELVTLAGHAPATVWADPHDPASAPKKYLAAMPIEDFREYVADATRAKSGKAPLKAPPTKRAAGDDASSAAAELTVEQANICKETGCDPTVFMTLKKSLGS